MIFTSALKTIAEDFEFLEGPVWHPDGYLLFSDIPANKIYQLRGDDEISVWKEDSGHSNGLTFDREGRLVACEHGNRRVSCTPLGGETFTLVERYQGKRLNSPNDCVVRSDGMVFFTDPPYGIEDEQKELPVHGVFCVTPGQDPVLIAGDYDRPNGLAFTPDESQLYIADTSREWIKIHQVDEQGHLDEGKVFAEVGRPDGIKVDERGHVFAASTEGLVAFDSWGERIDILDIPQRPANMHFGRKHGLTLFIAARTGLYKTTVAYPGITPLS